MPGRTLPTLLRAEVEAHNSAESCYVTIGDRVFDVTDFLEDHPGGSELVLEFAGKDVKKIMADPEAHTHTDSAYEILDECLVGFVDSEASTKAAPTAGAATATAVGTDSSSSETVYAATGMSSAEDLSKDTDPTSDYKTHKFLDLNRPLFPQMFFGSFSKDFYLEQVHRPRHYRGGESAPLFGNFLEPLSKTAWYVVPTLWLPPVVYGTFLGFCHFSNPLITASYWLLGLFLWTFIEYGLHRFLFHLDKFLPDHPYALTLHFVLHGIHHYLPMDRYRLVMPPALFLILATPFYKLAHTVFPNDWYAAVTTFCGGIFGYICYDCTHYFLHHKKLPSYVQELKKYHLAHHYQNFELGFGVTSRFWDYLFGTELEMAKPLKTN
ncbi:hypothetical protein DV735_g4786, partial [Chaetothyriales sp. CBS 134920]